ncbi:DegQ family serine endoprotease [Catenovulum sp. SM1970]|nr:DegQ family serine endoprotease [Marinifaba aquimaris]NTS75905.1 DegQ family serine endoprotease [Marinifaba aquimaris]
MFKANTPKLILLSLFLILSPASFANLPWFDNDQPPTLAPMLEKTTPAVVNISAAGTKTNQQQLPDALRYFFGNRAPQAQERPFKSVGSGVIINADKGYVVTNHHVIDDADKIAITLKDGRQFDAKLLGSDADSDIALLQIDAENLTDVKVADSDKLRVGDFAIAIGNPFGLGQTVTSGIISALGRSGLGIEQYENFIQTDAAINSGNSGGALVNFNGELIGINTAILGPNGGNVGIGFAIPANMMQSLVDQILEYGEVRRGVLGITGSNLNAELAEALELKTTQGAFVGQVFEDTAAADAGLQAGDVIVSANGQKITSFHELRAKVGTLGAGKVVKLGVIRDGKALSVKVTLGQSEGGNLAASSLHPAFEGATLSNGQTNKQEQGVEVTEVEARSAAHAIGLKSGDIIVGVNRKRVESISQLRERLDDASKKGLIALNVVRGNASLYIMIR